MSRLLKLTAACMLLLTNAGCSLNSLNGLINGSKIDLENLDLDSLLQEIMQYADILGAGTAG